MPPLQAESDTAREQLDRILASPGFAHNERLSRFLRFVVERHLEGRDEELKESLIAVEVFGRPPGYDPKKDPIVRTEASRLRARLSEYYLRDGKADPLEFELPKGGYVPRFRPGLPEPISAPRPAVRQRWMIAAVIPCVLAAVAVLVWSRFHQNGPIPIAVLPLRNLSDPSDPSQEYFADGLTFEIIRNLSIIDGLEVRSQTSSMALKGELQNIRDAGSQLNADYILEGSVQRSGQRLRITVQLVRVRDDHPLWSGKYDRQFTDIFAIQDEISRGIVNSLRLRLGQGRRRYETSAEAYDLYLRARALGGAGEFGLPGFSESIPVFEQVIAKDPAFAPGYAGLAVAHLVRSGNSKFDIASEVAKMRVAAEKAVELDPLSAESYDALGAALARQARWEQSEKSFRRAIQMQPGRAETHTHYAAYFLLPLGRIEEALQQLRMAEKNDPLSSFVHYWMGDALADAGRNDDAVAVCEKISLSNPHRRGCILGARVRQGRGREAIPALEAEPREPETLSALGCAYARTGRPQDAMQVFAGLTDISRVLIPACLGDKDGVFESLEHDAAVGPIRMGWILNRVDREHRGLLRGDSRLKSLRQRVGLPE